MRNNIKKNIAYNSIYQILILVLPFITAPYLSRKIGAAGIGTYSFAQSMAMYFTFITMLGLSNYGNRCIAEVQDNLEERSKVFFEIYASQLIMFAISIIAYIIYVIFFAVDTVAAVIMGIWVLSAMLDINWFFFGMEEFKLTVTRNTIIKVLSVVAIFIFVKSDKDVYTYIAIMAISTFVSQCCLWPYMKKFVIFIKPAKKGILKHFRPNLKLFIPVVAASIYNMMDKIMLGYMTNMSEVGFYENAEKIIKMIQSLIVAVGTVMLPRMTAVFSHSNDDKGNKYIDLAMKAVMIYVSAAIFGILATGKLFSEIYFGSGFNRTGELLMLLVTTVFFFGIGNVLRTQLLIPRKMDSVFVISSLIGAGLNIIVNAVMIPIWGAVGASIATIFAEVSVCIYQFFMARKYIRFSKYIPTLVITSLIGLVMYIVIKQLPVIENNILYFIEQVAVGGIVYVLLTAIIFISINKIKKKGIKNRNG